MSKLEESLAQVLEFAARDQNAPWPWGAPVREMHPFWCCEHRKYDHLRELSTVSGEVVIGGECLGCAHVGASNRFHDYAKGRGYRVDFAYPAQRIAIEVEGIRYDKQGGRHQTGAGFAKDLEKYSALELAGWRVIRVSRREISSGVALQLIEKALKERSGPAAAVEEAQ